MSRIRDLQERKKFYDAIAEQERLQREAEERPVKEALAEHSRLAAESVSLQKELIERGERDSEFGIPDDARGLRMSKAEGQAFAKSQAEDFISCTPDYYPCPENFSVLVQYILAQGIQIPTATVFKAAFNRLSKLGLLKEKPTQRDLESEAKDLIKATNFDNANAVEQTKARLEALKAAKDSLEVTTEATEQESPDTNESQQEVQASGFIGTDGKSYSDAELNALDSERFRRIAGLQRIREFAPVVRH